MWTPYKFSYALAQLLELKTMKDYIFKKNMGIPFDIMHWNIWDIDVWIFQFSSMFWKIIALRTKDLKKKNNQMLHFQAILLY